MLYYPIINYLCKYFLPSLGGECDCVVSLQTVEYLQYITRTLLEHANSVSLKHQARLMKKQLRKSEPKKRIIRADIENYSFLFN